RLSAIMAADVVGYSRLMGTNEVGTLTSLREHRTELIDPSIAAHQGRIVKLTGDGMLVEFPSVVSAVECAVDVQREMRNRNGPVPEERRIEFRIGINLGDVIVEGDDIFGDGVNVASRIEGIAKPGGVSVSSNVRENLGNKLDLVFEDMGDQELKNIEFPVRVFNVVVAAGASKPQPGTEPDIADADKPSIAVLPFTNMSDDRGQEFFSDGITEDIITDLSKISGLFVIGRNTSFTYKGKSVQLQQVAAELGVKFILEGSVRKSGERVRVTGQLIDGGSGGHLWADRYDRQLTDIFDIQDEITQSIVAQLKIKLLPKEKKAIAQAPTVNVEAYTYYLKGRQFFHGSTKSFLQLARQMFAKAVELDPLYARAYAGIANCDARLSGWYNVPRPGEEILATAAKAIALDPNLAEAHAARAIALVNNNHRAEAADAFERALELDPNSFDANLAYARFRVTEGDFDRAVELYRRAVESQQDDSQAPILLQMLLRLIGRDEEAKKYARLGLKRAEEQLRLHPESSRPAQLGATALANLGETDQAKAWMDLALAIDPDDANTKYNAACMWAQLGEPEKAFDFLEDWIQHVGPDLKSWFEHDSDLMPLRDHPRYQKLLISTKA
ncbi:MAG: adenylate/guanylate cyclase domain-containing protein, partial [Sphingomicrobium sp.]